MASHPNPVQRSSVAVAGFELHYAVAGEGAPMVLLHGDGASATDWQWVLPGLARQARVHALDLPGHGDSTKPQAPYSPQLFAEAVVAFLDGVGIERAVLVGHSLGGLVAIRAALAAPDRVVALCLVASGGLGRAVSPALAVQTLPGVGEMAAALGPVPPWCHQRALGRAVLLFANWWRVPPAWLAEQARLIARPGFAEVNLRTRRAAIDVFGQKDVVLPRLHRLPMPTLVVWGANDAVLPVTHAYAAMSVLPDARLDVFAGCGHMPQVERPDEFVASLTRFVAERARRCAA